ncbi:unnamed protein product [Schistosoma mattheei]|uniref:RING-type domain-containing protein n=1 Tax=Schistosoma mattheei TaxID=31246 RepID=A0AA85BLN2_9TREM|nr:unnamed protein product [Schistosoma mattheei]
MDELQRLYEHQTMMAIRIYSFLDNILTHLPSSRTNNNNDIDIDTVHSLNNTHNSMNTNDYVSSILSRQVNMDHHHLHQRHQQYPYTTTTTNVIDELNTSVGDIFPRTYENTQTSSSSSITSVSSTWLSNPQIYSSTLYDTINNHTINNISNNNDNDYNDSITKEIQPGGYCDEIFIYLSNSERQEYLCTICYMILKEAYQCQNQHKFCYGCIYTWSTGPTTGHDSCPVCRCDGLYAKNYDLNERINKKRIRCPTDGCNWMGLLSAYQQHEHRRYSPYELDLLLIDCKKDQMKSSSSSLLPITTQNQMVHNKEIPIKFNDIPQRNELLHVNNNNNSSLLHNNQINVNLGQVPTVCEPISQSTDQLSETSAQRLLTTTTAIQRQIRPLRNGNRQRQSRIQNRSILSTSESVNQSENNNNNMEETRINNSHGTTNHTCTQGLQSEHQQRILNTPVHSRRTRSHVASNTHISQTTNNIGHRQRINVRDSRIRVERLPNLRRQRQIRNEQIQQSLTHTSSQEYDNEFNSTEINSLLNVNSNDIHSHCLEEEFMGDHTELNVTDQHSDNQINLPAIRFNETLTCNLNTQPLHNNSNDDDNNNNTQTLLINNSVQRTNRPLEFRRLVPQRQRRVVEQLRETREQLAAMLRLMTMELEERQNRVLIPNLDIGTRTRPLRNPNNLFCENTEDSTPTPYVNNTVNRELTEYNNLHTSNTPRNVHRTNVYNNDMQENYYTSQSINSNILNSVNSNNTRDLSRTLLTPTYREQTITNPFTNFNSQQNNNNNNNQYNTPVTSTTNTTLTSSSPLISTTRLLARLRLNALQQTSPIVFFTSNNNNNITGNVNSSNRQEILSSSSSLTTMSSLLTGDSTNNDNEYNHDVSDDETD